MAYVKFLDENLYKKKERALRRYFKKSYMYVVFKLVPTLKKTKKRDGIYEVDLPTDKLFEKVYGKLQVKFSVKNDVAIIEDIVPNDILIACYEKEVPTYKGIPYDTDKDLTKIKIMERLI